MTYPDNIPTVRMSPPQFATSNININRMRPQFPMNSERFEQRSEMDSSHSFKRPRISDNNHSNALINPPPRMNHPPPNRRPGNIFFKTRICFDFEFGTCRNGENCSFAHGVEELRQPPPNWQEVVRPRTEERLQLGGNWNDDQKIIHKMNLCKKYYNGEECPYGDNCRFLHKDPAKFGDDSWKTRRESSSFSNSTIGNNLEDNKTVTKPPRGSYWKTKPCLEWKHTRSCPFGDGCHFAHGDAGNKIDCLPLNLMSDSLIIGRQYIAHLQVLYCVRVTILNIAIKHELQVPGGGIEAEAAVAIANSTKAVIPTLPTTGFSANYVHTLPASVSAATEEEKKAKKELLWKKLNKINRIYGDWIDDLRPDRPDLPREP
ncbi:zinc finger CCCH domain-containing protein 39-like [Vicia villosa]|uniref:zinc finger CCCH domain-containing protein 39-like n=1 Tax=Vicia villosa TaxID=3911 RepID=UPI00273BACC2|nr:zinc finger CCCH domain-containing protein 39-like [Vicia villosa]